MIQFIRGILASVEEDKVLVDVNGVGYGIFMSVQAMSSLPRTGSEVKIHTYLNVKEDAMQLFGFLTKDDLKIFKLLIKVSGVGPKGAQAVLSALSPDDLRFAVLSGDAKAIAQAPGIGKRTAEKIILELKDKLSMEESLEHAAEPGVSVGVEAETAGSVQSEAVQALVVLGYGSTEALKAVKKAAIKERADVEEVLRQALKNLL